MQSRHTDVNAYVIDSLEKELLLESDLLSEAGVVLRLNQNCWSFESDKNNTLYRFFYCCKLIIPGKYKHSKIKW